VSGRWYARALGGIVLLGALAGVRAGWAVAQAYGRHLERREVRRRNPIEWEGVE
jgi:hypothetical protein